MAKLVAHMLARAALWVQIYADISQKYEMGDISKGVANTLKPAIKYTKKNFRRNLPRRKVPLNGTLILIFNRKKYYIRSTCNGRVKGCGYCDTKTIASLSS
jgi:hypothetical protein